MQVCCCLMPASLSGKRSPNHTVARLELWKLRCKASVFSHPQGWEMMTDAVIHWINDHTSNVVFLLWGADAQKKASFINKVCVTTEYLLLDMQLSLQDMHLVLKTVHPSPLSVYRGFFGCKHFSQTNQYLVRHGRTPVDWSYLPETVGKF